MPNGAMLRPSTVADAWLGQALSTPCVAPMDGYHSETDMILHMNGTYETQRNLSRTVEYRWRFQDLVRDVIEVLPLLSHRARQLKLLVRHSDGCDGSSHQGSLQQPAVMSCRGARSSHAVVWPRYRMTERILMNTDSGGRPLLEALLGVNVPWSARRPQAVFRGSLENGFGKRRQKLNTSRLQVVTALREHGGTLFDTTGTKVPGPDGNKQNVEGAFLSPVQQAERYRMLLLLPGNGAASTTGWAFASGCAVLMEANATATVWTSSLAQPWEHYIPVALENTSDIIEKARWCVDNSDACEAIATASRQLFVRAYWPAASEPGGGSNRSAALLHARLAEVKREVLERLARHAAAHPECVPHVEFSTMHPHVESPSP